MTEGRGGDRPCKRRVRHYTTRRLREGKTHEQ
jgi:hypothetical protein